jgi:cell division protease FtsH
MPLTLAALGRGRSFFSTTIPASDDPGLIPLLEKHQVDIHVEPAGSAWSETFLFHLLPWLFLGLILLLVLRAPRRKGKTSEGLFDFAKSRARRYERTDTPIRFQDVAGAVHAKRDLEEIVDYLRDPSRYATLGCRMPRGILLGGPPETGKTLLARAVAGEANVPFYSASGSEFVEIFVGVGAARVRDLFANAKKEAPAVIFIDEIDAIGRARGAGLGGGHEEREQTLNQILSEMDGFTPHESVVVLAATNRPDVLDPALIRPGRFDRQITLDLPQRQARHDILRVHTRQVPMAHDVDLARIAAQTVGFSGADLQNLVNEAALLAGRRRMPYVSAREFDEAREKILLGDERDEPIAAEEHRIAAYHEAGHALLAKLLPGADPLHKVTIIPRSRSLGVTHQMPTEDRHSVSRRDLLNRLAIMLGGRVAEQLVFQDLTSGAGDDLKRATQLARRMVCQWGMSERLGPMVVRQGEEHMFLRRETMQERDTSEQTARLIDEEIHRLLCEAEQRAQQTLAVHRVHLEALAQALLTHETLDAEMVDHLLKRPSASGKILSAPVASSPV